MSKLTSEEITFLKELGKEMKEQDSLSTASPRLWVVRDIKRSPTQECYADGYQAIDEGSNSEIDNDDISEMIEDIIYEEGDDVIDKFLTYCKLPNESESYKENWNIDLKIDFLRQFDTYVDLIPYKEEFVYSENSGFFFTKEAAEKHINSNKHHYTDQVHPYCIHAWRNPQMEKVIDILGNVDWQSYK